jgi:hypothetical protein
VGLDLVWGDLAQLVPEGGQINLGSVQQIECAASTEGHLHDSLRPDPGTSDFILARESGGPAHYGLSTNGRGCQASEGDCP